LFLVNWSYENRFRWMTRQPPHAQFLYGLHFEIIIQSNRRAAFWGMTYASSASV
jgi:hypothetical protein